MKAKELERRVKGAIKAVKENINGYDAEPVNIWCGRKLSSAQFYGAVSMKTMEDNLADLGNGHKRITTFMSDLSVAEWCGGYDAVLDTTKRVINEWKDNVEYMSEFVLCTNWKAWEHDARSNYNWARFYSILFECVRDLMYDYYEGDEEKVGYMWRYLD